MRLRRVIGVGLVLLAAAGIGVCRAAARNTGDTSKSASSTTGSTSHRSSKKSNVRSKARERGQKTPAPERISQIQQALGKDGSFAGTPNGKWDDSTVEAMRKFQAGHRLNPSGKLDALTLEKLGLGSQTAGVAAPILPVNSSSRLTSASQVSQQP
jgi:peptidoglycan hydrolase-like protein with peptidoglycan-binding domain